ncbi:heavy metal translocating P-type ATPase [Allostreptomyces psammosilenae]|uniref:Heavy metal translocating P-type ATPase n=1 Tax=Allostreptomyces psammosilenae TaxID=1892865 RepID=A0A852ZS36_9ACTN|nr:heavy metal translocating P-type ATPase [Allostreptomyces psammosilenae]NYI04277.1 heavy metal translocating P-type ATPase [Allostreptomyces psammosilenae]
MPPTLVDNRPAAPAGPVPAARPRRTRVFALPEVRWATAATVAFLLAFPLQLAGAPAWLWGPLYAVCYAAGGWEPGWSGLRALRERTLDVDVLMVVAALGAAAIGQVLDGALLIVIFATSGALEALATQRTADSVRGLLDLAPATAVRLRAGEAEAEEQVAVTDLRVGDVVLVRPGERVAADGVVLDGASEVDQATITGEPLPAPKRPGDEVFAGTLNGTGFLRVRVERDASESVIARIVAMVEEASETKAPTQLFIEKVEQRYSVGVVLATLALFAVPLALGADFTETLLRAMTFMIVASPCAVVLATMPPLLSAIANAGRHGVLVKSAVVMERLGTVTHVAFDKTGTLTEGAPRVAEVLPLTGADTVAPGGGTGAAGGASAADAVLALAAAAEHPSEHPLAGAVVAAARERALPLEPAREFSSAPGRGVRAVVSGHEVRVGSPAALLGADPDGRGADRDGAGAAEGVGGEAVRAARDVVARVEGAGRTAVVVLVDDVPAGVLAIADRIRPGAARAVAALDALTGGTPTLLTGDNPRAAARLGEEVGITDVRAGLLPQDKVAAVRSLAAEGGKVLVVGDGVNDAPALAAAHTGIAMGRAGSDLALETADAVVVRDELATVPAVVALSRQARRLVTQNLVIAGVCIGVLVVWDLAGHLPLPLGVAGHEGSTVLVGLNGLRLLRESAWRRALRAGHPAS